MVRSRTQCAALAIAVAVMMLAGTTTALVAGYLESDYPSSPTRVVPPPRPIPPPRPVPPPPRPRPTPYNEVTALLDDIVIGPAYHYRGLALFPLTLARGADHRRYQTLGEGLANGTVTVRERKRGVVSELVLRNSAGVHTFVLAGEILLGGKQNRLLRQDVLLPPRSGDVVVPVYCGQKGRWTAGGRFHSKATLAPQNLRRRAMAGAPQAEVWAGIRRDAARLKAPSRSENLQQVYETKAVREALAGYRTEFVGYLRRRAAVGFVAARYGTIVGAEVFRSRSLFAREREKLIDAYAVDCIGWHPTSRRRRPIRWPDVHQARVFLSRAYRADYGIRTAPGVGRLLTISGRSTGQALGYERSCVHLSLYQPVPIIYRPVPIRPMPMPMPRRRPPVIE